MRGRPAILGSVAKRRRKPKPPPSHEDVEAAAVYFVRLAVENLLAVQEVSHSLATADTLAECATALLKHRDRRRSYVRTARLADMLPALYDLIETERRGIELAKKGGRSPISPHIMIEKVRRWARSRRVELTDDEAKAILVGPIPKGAKQGGPRERLEARLAVAARVAQSTLQKISKAASTPISDALGIKSPEEFARAVDHEDLPAHWLIYYVLVALKATPEQRDAALRACGCDPNEVREAFATVSDGTTAIADEEPPA